MRSIKRLAWQRSYECKQISMRRFALLENGVFGYSPMHGTIANFWLSPQNLLTDIVVGDSRRLFSISLIPIAHELDVVI